MLQEHRSTDLMSLAYNRIPGFPQQGILWGLRPVLLCACTPVYSCSFCAAEAIHSALVRTHMVAATSDSCCTHLGLRSGFAEPPPDLDRPGRLPHSHQSLGLKQDFRLKKTQLSRYQPSTCFLYNSFRTLLLVNEKELRLELASSSCRSAELCCVGGLTRLGRLEGCLFSLSLSLSLSSIYRHK